MPVKFDFSDFERVAATVEGVERQLPFVCAYALTNAMKDGREAERELMPRVFDRPTRYTLNALQVTPATKNNLRAELGFRYGFGKGTPAWKYLGPAVEGGPRKHKGFERLLIAKGIMLGGEFAVPSSRCPVDGYGNVTGAFITRMLSALGAQSDRMQNTVKKPKRSNRKRNLDYFVMRGHAKAPDGIYLQQPKWAVPIFLFVKRANYAKRFPYYEEAKRVIPGAFQKHFLIGWDRFVVNDTRGKRNSRA